MKLERIRAALGRLPVRPEIDPEDLDRRARIICAQAELFQAADLKGWVADKVRKRIAAVLTVSLASTYATFTGKPVTRRQQESKNGNDGQQETGEFATFLADVFDAVGIKASAAGQVKAYLAGSLAADPEHVQDKNAQT